MSRLADLDFTPAPADTPPLSGSQLSGLADELGADWEVIEEHHLIKRYKFKNFQQALDFTNRVGALAEELDHHPILSLSWGWVEVKLWTHRIDGLAESDFVWAARADQLAETRELP